MGYSMVGIVLVKDFFTGSYTYVKLAIFEGSSFSDINYESPFSQYVVDIENREIVSKIPSSTVPVEVSYLDLMSLCDESLVFLAKNPYAVSFEFKRENDKTEFRVVPTNQGSFVMPDLYNFFHGNAVYFPVEIYTFKTGNGSLRANSLEADVCCELINYTLHALSDEITAIFYQSGGTLYLDIAPVIKNKSLRPSLKKYLSKYPGAYKNALEIFKKREKHISIQSTTMPGYIKKKEFQIEEITEATASEYDNLINTIRYCKMLTLNVASDKFSGVKKDVLIKNLFEFALNDDFVKIKNLLYNKILNYSEKLVDYNYLSSRNYIKYLSVSDILTSEFSAIFRANLPSRAELLKCGSTDFKKRKNSLIAYDGTAFRFDRLEDGVNSKALIK